MGLFSKPELIGPGGSNDADRARIAELERRVARLEAQLVQLAATPVGAVAAAAATAVTETWMAEVQALTRAGKKINAIKLYREKTGSASRRPRTPSRRSRPDPDVMGIPGSNRGFS